MSVVPSSEPREVRPADAPTDASASSDTVGASATSGLRRVLGAAGLTSLGIGGTIGTGIFVMAGAAARDVAGPAILVSFLVAALACGCAAWCYAEMAARYPQAGSAYAYARALTPRWLAWLVGWNLIAQYGLAAASIAQGWSHYFQDALVALFGAGAALPPVLRGAGGSPPGALVDLPALAIVAAIIVLLLRGIAPSVRANHVVVAIKLAVVLMVIGVGLFYVHPANWTPFAPFGWGGLQLPGISASGPPRGMLAGAAIVFYAYLGFEALTNYSEESRRPGRDVPRSILQSLAVCTLLYIGMAVVLTGMVPYDRLSPEAPVSEAFGQVGLPWVRTVVAVGALIGITSVLLVILLSLPRILLAIGRDGILPRGLFDGVHPETGVPYRATWIGGAAVGLLTAFVPLNALGVVAVMSNMLTFVVVATLVLRLSDRSGAFADMPDHDHPEGSPGVSGRVWPRVIASAVTIVMCVLLVLSLPAFGWPILGGWLAVGVVIFALRHRAAGQTA